jgi:hypothetical protein
MASKTQNWMGLWLVLAVPVVFLIAREVYIGNQASSHERALLAEHMAERAAEEAPFEWSRSGTSGPTLTVHPGLGDRGRIEVPAAPAGGHATNIGIPGAGPPDSMVW